jgi:citrate lyase subunit beta/citryl-CoA lyase
MPATNARAHEKAVNLAADALIFDLEGAVSPAHKAAGRQQIHQSIKQLDYSKQSLFLRINHPDTAFACDDIALLAQHPQFSGIVLPKVETPKALHDLQNLMRDAQCSCELVVLAMLETPLGILNAKEIAQSTARISGFIAGTNDLAAAMHLPDNHARDGLHYALSHMVLVAKAFGYMVFDGVYNQVNDPAGFIDECAQGRSLGFDGKTLIHPSQIDAANNAFSPSIAEVAHAQEIIDHWESVHSGVTAVNGTMIEELHVQNAQRILALHQRFMRPTTD